MNVNMFFNPHKIHAYRFLSEVAAMSHLNSMDINNLASIFSPTLMRPLIESINLEDAFRYIYIYVCIWVYMRVCINIYKHKYIMYSQIYIYIYTYVYRYMIYIFENTTNIINTCNQNIYIGK
jgi:hypothetical protein